MKLARSEQLGAQSKEDISLFQTERSKGEEDSSRGK
jgi:hypothetical protein